MESSGHLRGDLGGLRNGKATDDEGHVDDPYEGKNPVAVALGRLGGQKGGNARATKLTSEERPAIAKEAAEARWAKS